MDKELTVLEIEQLSNDIIEIKRECRDKLTETLLDMKWRIGEKITVSRVKQTGDFDHSYRQLEEKTGINFIDLHRCVKFYEEYPEKNYPIIAWRKLIAGGTEIEYDIEEETKAELCPDCGQPLVCRSCGYEL